jgi:predicted phage tail protein
MSDNFLFGDIEKEFGRELRTDINYPFEMLPKLSNTLKSLKLKKLSTDWLNSSIVIACLLFIVIAGI